MNIVREDSDREKITAPMLYQNFRGPVRLYIEYCIKVETGASYIFSESLKSSFVKTLF